MISGLGSQLTRSRVGLIEALVERGYFVIRFDNRDVGLSTWFDDVADERRTPRETPIYTLSDMANDAVGLLVALDLASAHIVGTSMGGMIAQVIALEHPEKVRSLVSIMSSTGSGHLRGDVLVPFLTPVNTRDEVIDNNVAMWRVLSGPGFPFDEDLVRQEAGNDYDRAFHPKGTARQQFAIRSSVDRSEQLAHVTVPTLVVHGESDLLVSSSGGEATAAAVPGSRLKLVPGMGHYIPPELYDELATDFAKLFREGDERK
jgi:pimeloyl-ACP methyl ester carboxylesterase